MDTVYKSVLIGHTLIALMIIVLVLIQRGKGADAGAAFGAGASGTVFGARGSGSFFSRLTAVFATLFFVTSLGLAYLSTQVSRDPDSRLEAVTPAAEEVADEVPAIDDVVEAVDADDDADMPSIEQPADDDAAPEITDPSDSE